MLNGSARVPTSLAGLDTPIGRKHHRSSQGAFSRCGDPVGSRGVEMHLPLVPQAMQMRGEEDMKAIRDATSGVNQYREAQSDVGRVCMIVFLSGLVTEDALRLEF